MKSKKLSSLILFLLLSLGLISCGGVRDPDQVSSGSDALSASTTDENSSEESLKLDGYNENALPVGAMGYNPFALPDAQNKNFLIIAHFAGNYFILNLKALGFKASDVIWSSKGHKDIQGAAIHRSQFPFNDKEESKKSITVTAKNLQTVFSLYKEGQISSLEDGIIDPNSKGNTANGIFPDLELVGGIKNPTGIKAKNISLADAISMRWSLDGVPLQGTDGQNEIDFKKIGLDMTKPREYIFTVKNGDFVNSIKVKIDSQGNIEILPAVDPNLVGTTGTNDNSFNLALVKDAQQNIKGIKVVDLDSLRLKEIKWFQKINEKRVPLDVSTQGKEEISLQEMGINPTQVGTYTVIGQVGETSKEITFSLNSIQEEKDASKNETGNRENNLDPEVGGNQNGSNDPKNNGNQNGSNDPKNNGNQNGSNDPKNNGNQNGS
ncbi:MAG: hypothetical protein KBD63_07695, partial [Bacteriovoracaceae bacterium]|nr:hypothetical protein [Bacteriovoracaceae bacterium]